ncbi:MAG: DUF4446 family protein [Peptoniphilaceae bacterium]|nr:DUF4446 family protein [Peptoniphilaceae bacterium]MDY6018897.1 DUF4446 family protein [Anaerococcus sp.]
MIGIYIGLAILALLVIIELSMIMTLNQKMKRQKRRYDHLLRGTNPDVNIEELILSLNDQIEISNKQLRNIDQRSLDTKDTSMGAVSKMAVLHYDAFEGQTNALSFSLCMLDSYHNGFILTNLYSNEGSNIYLKEIVRGESKAILSKDEKDCLNKAKN